MERHPELLTAVCGFGERDLLLLVSAGRLSMVRSHRYEILASTKVDQKPEIYIVDDSLHGRTIWSEMVKRFGDQDVPILGIGDAEQPKLLQGTLYRHYKRPILATRMLNALDALVAGDTGTAGEAAKAQAPTPTPAPRRPTIPPPATPAMPFRPHSPARTLEELRGSHILVITENQAISYILESRLASMGVAVTCANDVASATGLLEGGGYSFILLESKQSSEGNLFAVVRELKQDAGGAPAVVLVRDELSPHDRIRGVLSGADDFLLKPFSLRQLQELVLTYC